MSPLTRVSSLNCNCFSQRAVCLGVVIVVVVGSDLSQPQPISTDQDTAATNNATAAAAAGDCESECAAQAGLK